MKLQLTIAMLMIAGVAWGQTNVHEGDGSIITNEIIRVDTSGIVTNRILATDTDKVVAIIDDADFAGMIRQLAKSGAICAALGFHCWGTDWESVVQLVYYPNGQSQSRKCRICGKVEIYKGEWK